MRKPTGRAVLAAAYARFMGQIGALRTELTVYTDNARAIALYRKFGLEIAGTFRGYAMRDGQYTDAHAMARLHPHPPRIAAATITA